MPGLVPAIHVFAAGEKGKTWMPGTRPGMTRSGATRMPVNPKFTLAECREPG